MLRLRRNSGRILEPSCGDGVFLRQLPGAVGIELDPAHAPAGALILDFFDYDVGEKFTTIIGNPPYVRFQDIAPDTQSRLDTRNFDRRSNLYLFFIAKALRHLAPGGELIFITPRDFLKATSAVRLNHWLFEHGTMTDVIDLGDSRVFADALPNCMIWRYVLGDFSRQTRWAAVPTGANLAQRLAAPDWQPRHFLEAGGHLQFVRGDYPLRLSDIADVRVGAVSGADEVFCRDGAGAREFVFSETVSSGATRTMLWPGAGPAAELLPFKARLLARKICTFTEANWWHWGRGYPQTAVPRVYVNHKTRRPQPFFVHDCPHYDGAVLAIFPRRTGVSVNALAAALNAMDWADLAYVCDGRFQFNQRSLMHAPLPASFSVFLPENEAAKALV
jgi:adenine-specific DNA-methyltransferase